MTKTLTIVALVTLFVVTPAFATPTNGDAAGFTFSLSQVLSAVILALGGLGGVWKLAVKKAREEAEKAAEDAVAQCRALLDRDGDLIANVIAQADTERRLRAASTILIVNPDGRKNGLWQQLRALGFRNLDVSTVDDYDDASGRGYTAVVLEDMSAEQVEEFVLGSTRDATLIYHPGAPMRFENVGAVMPRVTFSNSKVAVHANLMRVLRYQDALIA